MGIAADLTDEQVDERARAAVRLALEKQKALGVPIIFCDPDTHKIYKMFSDGTKIEVDTECFAKEQGEQNG